MKRLFPLATKTVWPGITIVGTAVVLYLLATEIASQAIALGVFGIGLMLIGASLWMRSGNIEDLKIGYYVFGFLFLLAGLICVFSSFALGNPGA